MLSELRKQPMAWMETDYSKHTHFRWNWTKGRLEHLGVLGIMGETASLRERLYLQVTVVLSCVVLPAGCVVSRGVVWCGVAWRGVAWRGVALCRFVLHCVGSSRVASCRLLSPPVAFCRFLSPPVASCRLLSLPVASCRLLSPRVCYHN